MNNYVRRTNRRSNKWINEGLEQVIKDAEITKQNIRNCLNAPNLEDQLQQDGEEYIQTINESKKVMDPYYNELKEYLNDEEVLKYQIFQR